MTQKKITKDEFKALIYSIVKDINRVQGAQGYDLTFNEDGDACWVIPATQVLYTHYFEIWQAISIIYDIVWWVTVQDGKPCVEIINN